MPEIIYLASNTNIETHFTALALEVKIQIGGPNES